MSENSDFTPTAVSGITYYYPPDGFLIKARDGRVEIACDGIPMPLLNEDFISLDGKMPSYDAFGRGIYCFLRISPDAPLAERYAAIFRDAYPHLLAELATELVMLDKKDVDLPYLDRKINYLKIFALLEPDNQRFPLEIGATYFDKALTLASLGTTTIYLFAAEKHLRKAYLLNQDDLQVRYLAGEVCFLLGKYSDCLMFWNQISPGLPSENAQKVLRRCRQIENREFSPVPAVDYLQAVGVAIESFESGDFEEAAAIIQDVYDNVAAIDGFPLAEANYILGLCYVHLDIPRYAEQYFQQALQLDPEYEDAQQQLIRLGAL